MSRHPIQAASVPVLPAYSVSKAAALSLTQSLRALLAGLGISVFDVMPGPIDTDMVRALDIPKTPPEDVARATLDGNLGAGLPKRCRAMGSIFRAQARGA